MKFNRKIHLDRTGSATHPAKLGSIVEVSPKCVAEEGAIVVGRALGENKNYGELELPSGRKAKIIAGNLVAGVLGARKALLGYMGDVPKTLEPGDHVHLLNMGSVLGICESWNRDLGPPIPIEVLGAVVRNGIPVNIKDFALPPCAELRAEGPPLVLILGTCMNAGKTYAGSEIIRLFSVAGLRVASGKLSGVAALRDLLSMSDNGAIATASFIDCGLPSTVNMKDLASVARSVITHLERSSPDLILLELGDGIIGGYNTRSIREDPSILRRTRARVLCANDLVGAWGGVRLLEPLGHRPDVISGPATDNAVGTHYITDELKTGVANARSAPKELARLIANCLGLNPEFPK